MDKITYLSDRQWKIVSAFLPSRKGVTGRPPLGDRRVMEGILHVIINRIAWMELPLGVYPAFTTCFRRYTSWVKTGVWEDMMGALYQDLKTRKGVDLWRIYVHGQLLVKKSPKEYEVVYPPTVFGCFEDMVVTILFLLNMMAMQEDDSRRKVKA